MDAMRKQLDVLMGANRNGDVREVNRKYFDRDVCRLFLAGLCPHDLFQLTKMDLGPCPKVHSLQLRKDYEEVKAKGSENFDRELEDMIDRLIVECERKIQRALKRLADEDAKAAIAISVSEVTLDDEVVQLSKVIKEKMKEVDNFDFEGRTDDKIKAMEVVEKLRSKRADMQATLLLDAFNKDRASIPQPAPTQMAPLPPPPPPPPTDARTQQLINEKLSKAEALGEQGMVEEAQKALEEVEALKRLSASRQEPASDPSKYTVADVRIIIITTYGELDKNDYIDPRTAQVATVDHVKQTCTKLRPALDEELPSAYIEEFRCAIDIELSKYVCEAYPKGVCAVYCTSGKDIEEPGADFGLAVVISAARRSPQNFCNGNWRSVWTLEFSYAFQLVEIKGKIQVGAHYFEEGNVQLDTDVDRKDSTLMQTPEDTAVSVTNIIRHQETEYFSSLEESYSKLSDATFKDLRRKLPVTRTLFPWHNTVALTLTRDLAKELAIGK